MAAPQVPPRPARSQHSPLSGTNLPPPQIPPRPAGRRNDRSLSPSRDAYAPSPLNDSPFPARPGSTGGSRNHSRAPSGSELPRRPSSVTLPSIGQEGSEYAELEYDETDDTVGRIPSSGSPTHTRNVDSDLPLHAPKPSLSQADAKQRISTVTRTDSSQAVSAGAGRRSSMYNGDDKDPHARPLRQRVSASFRPSSAASFDRPESAQLEEDQGIPEIGLQVPMYPNAGDVQAPSPAPTSQHAPGIGYQSDGSRPRHHSRKRSGRESFQNPPGSYGLHGHGKTSADQFEKAWYDKHPEALARAREDGQYSPALSNARNQWVLSSEDLNKLVKSSVSNGAGFGTAPDVAGLPDEQIGWKASEEYASRMSTPRPASSGLHKVQSNHSYTHLESPLRRTSYPINDINQSEDFGMYDSTPVPDELDENVIHIEAPSENITKYGKKGDYDESTVDLGPHGGNTEEEGGYIEERGYGVPILASDEITPGSENRLPAVACADSRSEDIHEPEPFHRSAGNSRPSSRPGSVHGQLAGLSRFISAEDHDLHTPLENVDEYEPLFPEDDKLAKSPQTRTDRVRHVKRRFPSQDIWEDTPNSLQLQAEVATPEPVPYDNVFSEPSEKRSAVFETPEAEGARKGEVSEAEKAELLPREERLKKSNFKPHINADVHRPGLTQRFPSRDIWEDSPDSARLETTVSENEVDTAEATDAGLEAGAVVNTIGRPSPIPSQTFREGATAGQPVVPPRPAKSKANEPPASDSVPQIALRSSRSNLKSPLEPSGLSQVFTAKISPERQQSATERKGPAIPTRPKPQVPNKLGRTLSAENTENSVRGNDYGDGDEGSREQKTVSPVLKPKPTVPARPAGSKIAALQAGFMSDLNNRLKLGPQAAIKPQEEPEEKAAEEKAPLSDARKSRARGPARRKPTPSPSAAKNTPLFTMVQPVTVWQIGDDGIVQIVESRASTAAKVANDGQESRIDEEGGESATKLKEEINDHGSEGTDSDRTGPLTFTADNSAEGDNQVELTKSDVLHTPAALIAQLPETAKDEPPAPALEAKDSAVQTGETDIAVDTVGGERRSLMVIEGGSAQDGENVVLAGSQTE